MSLEDLPTSRGDRLRTTVCSLCGAKRGEDFTRFCRHLEEEHSFGDLQIGESRRTQVRCDGGSVRDEDAERGAGSVDETDRLSKLGPTVRMAKYFPNGTEPKDLDYYVDVGAWTTGGER
jgi:hypothetical protein